MSSNCLTNILAYLWCESHFGTDFSFKYREYDRIKNAYIQKGITSICNIYLFFRRIYCGKDKNQYINNI